MRPFLRHAGVWARAGGFMRALSGQVEVEEERGQPMLLPSVARPPVVTGPPSTKGSMEPVSTGAPT